MNDSDIFNGVLGLISNNRMTPIVERSANAISTLRSRDMQQGLGVAPFGGLVDVPAAKSWIALWLSNRRLQLAENAGGTREGAIAASEQNRKLWSVPAYTSVGEMNSVHGDMIQALESEARSGGVLSKFSGIKAGMERSVLNEANTVLSDPAVYGSYLTNGGGRLVVARDNPDGHQSVMVHELSHAIEARPQEAKIAEIMKGAKINGTPNPYLESPTEIHSRLMQIRHDLKLDPRKHYTPKDIQQMRNSSGNKFKIFDRYDDKTILRLLNEVASVRVPTNRVNENA